MVTQEFKALFCQRFGCSPSDYAQRAFRECLYWHAKPLAHVLWKLSPKLFAEDFKFINYLGEAIDSREARAQAADFREGVKPNFLRKVLKIRVSGRKATRLAQKLFSQARERA